MMNRELADHKEDSIWEQINAVEESAVNPVADDGHELVYDQKTGTTSSKIARARRTALSAAPSASWKSNAG